jgi:TolB protein
MKKLFLLVFALAAFWFALSAQDFSGTISKGQQPHIAIPDLRGTGDAQKFMAAFNQTLWNDVNGSGLLKMVPKTSYPLTVPQQPSDFDSNSTPGQNLGGRAMSDWAAPPASANYLAFGYTAIQNGVFVLRGWLFDLSQATPTAAQVIGKNYLGSVDEAGARKTAHEFAADIIARFGGKSLFGTHIYFVHQAAAGAPKEIWVMDWDGGNQRQVTHFNSLSIEPSVSPDGSRIAFTSYAKGTPGIFVFSVDPVRDLHFYNQSASVNSAPSFTADGKQILYSSSAGGCCRIFAANPGWQRLQAHHALDVHRYRTQGKSQDGQRRSLRFRAVRPAADLPHEHRRRRYRAPQRRHRRSLQPVVASQWATDRVLVDARFRRRKIQRFHHGRGFAPLYTVDPR